MPIVSFPSVQGARLPLSILCILCGLAGPATAQYFGGGVDFGRSAGEDVLDGGPSSGLSGRSSGGFVEGGFGPRDLDRRDRYDRRADGYRRPAYRDGRRYGFEDRGRPGIGRHRPAGRSIVIYEAPSRSTYFRGTGVFANANPSVVVYGGPYDGARAAYPAGEAPLLESGPKIIDVSAERLDAVPVGPDGISMTYAGGAKIIRIASTGEADGRAVSGRPSAGSNETDGMSTSSVRRADAGSSAFGFEPWTEEWRRDCTMRYPSFDERLGTFRDETGRRRFCTGDPV